MSLRVMPIGFLLCRSTAALGPVWNQVVRYWPNAQTMLPMHGAVITVERHSHSYFLQY
jgi:hypothetical protein